MHVMLIIMMIIMHVLLISMLSIMHIMLISMLIVCAYYADYHADNLRISCWLSVHSMLMIMLIIMHVMLIIVLIIMHTMLASMFDYYACDAD